MQHGSMLRALVHDKSIGGLMIRQGRASNQWLYSHWWPLLVAYFSWRGLLCSDWHSFTCRGRWQVLFNYRTGPSRDNGVLTDVIDMSWGKHCFLEILGICHDFRKHVCLGYNLCTFWQCWATWSEWMEVWYPISCWRSRESRGIELCAM